MRPGKIRGEIMDYLRPSTMEQADDGTWTSFLTWRKVLDGEITGLDLIVVKEDVGKGVRSYLKEHTLDFPGVEVRDQYLRSYPQGDMAAQILGHLGEIDADELKEQHFKGYAAGDVVGKDGLEDTYDTWLRGRDGVARIEVDALGRPKQTEPVGGRMAEPGHTLVTTLDAEVQAAAEEALRTGISLAHKDGKYAANGGAAVVLDVRNGEILGMASYPTYDPSVWVGGISTKDYKQLTRKSANNPMINRPISETKAVGSTFKAVTAVAALEEGRDLVRHRLLLPGLLQLDVRQRGPAAEVQVLGGRTVTGRSTWSAPSPSPATCTSTTSATASTDARARRSRTGPNASAWARSAGIDIPGESAGRVPTPGWKKGYFETEIDKLWKPGDSVNLSVGQGDLEASPLQLAVAYAAVANGGKVVTPHLGLKVVDAAGQTVRTLQPAPAAQGGHLAEHPRRGASGPLRGLAQRRRHLGGRLPELRRGGVGQDGHGRGLGRHLQALRGLRLVRELRALRGSQVRDRRHDREGRPRLHGRRSGHASHLRRPVRRRRRRLHRRAAR